MLEALYLKTIEKKDEIYEFFENIAKDLDIEKVKKEYVKEDFDKSVQDRNFSAVDGSFNKIKYMGAFFYALTSQCIISKKGEGVVKESSVADISKVSSVYTQQIERILSLEMNIFELKSTLDTLRKHDDVDYMLMDGSLRGSLMSYRPIYSIPPEIMKILPKYYKSIEESIRQDMKLEIVTEVLRGSVAIECGKVLEAYGLDEKYGELETDVLTHLKQIEQLLTIYYILREYGEKIICISKTSSTKSLFNESIPDAAVIEYTCRESGFTHPREQTSNRIVREIGNEKRTINYPVKNLELSDTVFTTTFTKLENKSNVLKIELPRNISEDELKDILNNLESISVEGYPHILKKAHDEVKIKTKDIKRLAKRIGLDDFKTGRDMLN
ncbi:MAG: hypothetical protein BZ138_05430 [Methanosphaera sp. rholeuAM270]|nr:MAG: hypothetical protein BZ138_05430 [Methanosphaera sp. rholeuAM270]